MPQHIIDAAGGIPLFIEELTLAFLDSRRALLQRVDSPSRRLNAPLAVLPIGMHAALLGQIDRLGEERAIAQICAVLGQTFRHDVLASVAEMSGSDLNFALERLMDAGLLQRPTGAVPAYKFKHPLMQEALYSTVSAEDCKSIHLKAAEAIKAMEAQSSIEPEVLAHHLARAGEPMESARWWLKAGHAALAQSAKLDAIEHLKRGLKLLRNAPPSSERDNLERQLLIASGPALMAVHGASAPEPQRAFERAMKLTDDATPVSERLQILAGLCNIRWVRSELYAGLAVAQQFFELAQASQCQLNLAHCMMGRVLAPLGELAAAKEHFEAVVEDYRNQKEYDAGRRIDELVVALAYLSRIYFSLGYPDQATAACDEALSVASNGADALSIAIALGARIFLATHCADAEDASVHINMAIAHRAAHKLPLFEHWANFNRGALFARLGNVEEGIKLMELAIAKADARQSPMFRPFQLHCLASAYLQFGNFSQAILKLDEGLLVVEKTGEYWSEPSMRRVRGEVLMALGRRAEAYQNFEIAMTKARRYGVMIEVLRIATALARHAENGAEAKEARELLRTVYAGFKEGHNTPDLRAAREQLALLDCKGNRDDEARHSA